MAIFANSSKSSRLLKALSDPTRLRIIERLSTGEKCVTELVQSLRLEQPKVSHHLRILRENDIILDRRDGRRIIYCLHPARFKSSKLTFTISNGACEVTFQLRHREDEAVDGRAEEVAG